MILYYFAQVQTNLSMLWSFVIEYQFNMM